MSLGIDPVLGSFPETVEISNSEMQTFKQCRRRWYFGNYLGLAKQEAEHTGPLPLGTRIHNALEKYYIDGDNLIDAYNRLQRQDAKKFEASDKYYDEDEAKKFNDESDLGRIMLEGYLEWLDEENMDVHIKVVSAEEKLEYRFGQEFHDGRAKAIGKVDMRVERAEDGSRAILDHKTAAPSGFSQYWKTAHMSEQLLLYCLLEQLTKESEKPVDGGIYNLLKKVKRTGRASPPFYERHDVRFNQEQISAFWSRLLGTIHDMMSVRDALDNGADHRFVAYPTPSKDCTWICPFFHACTMVDDGSSADRYLESYFKQVNPLARYETNDDKETNV